LGIEILETKNQCLLSKWLFKMLNEEGVWQELLKNKYLHSKSLAQVTMTPTDEGMTQRVLTFVLSSFRPRSKHVKGMMEAHQSA
jgi:hypothetical protein